MPVGDFATENAIVASLSRQWPLLIDPQAQASQWIKRAHASLPFLTFRVDSAKPRRGRGSLEEAIENAVQLGATLLLEEMGEQIDTLLDPILNRVQDHSSVLPSSCTSPSRKHTLLAPCTTLAHALCLINPPLLLPSILAPRSPSLVRCTLPSSPSPFLPPPLPPTLHAARFPLAFSALSCPSGACCFLLHPPPSHPLSTPLFPQNVRREDGLVFIRITTTEVEYDDNFKLYMTTTLANPHYLPQALV